jgi:Fe2+ or Zn2+ uptake regulation protein
MSVDVHAAAAERLAALGQRYTRGRRMLVEALEGARRPLTIGDLLRDRPSLPQSSAYRNLSVLEQAGVVHRVVTSDEFARYELTESLTEHHHHHLICSSCGSVADFTVSKRMERTLEDVLARAAEDAGFQAEHHRLDLVGVCADCA